MRALKLAFTMQSCRPQSKYVLGGIAGIRLWSGHTQPETRLEQNRHETRPGLPVQVRLIATWLGYGES